MYSSVGLLEQAKSDKDCEYAPRTGSLLEDRIVACYIPISHSCWDLPLCRLLSVIFMIDLAPLLMQSHVA